MAMVTTSSWRHDWFCLCPSDVLGEDGSHVTVDLPDLSITVQNFRGARAGFWNVCSHRGTKLRPAGCGRGQLRCPYHGWLYDAAGVPVGIPDNDRQYRLDPAARRALALRPILVEEVGGWVFVRVDPGGETLAQALGDALPRIVASAGGKASAWLGDPIPSSPRSLVWHNLSLFGTAMAEIALPAGEHGSTITRYALRAFSDEATAR